MTNAGAVLAKQAARLAARADADYLADHTAVRDSGAWLEDKRYAVAVHTRRVADPQRWAAPIDQTAREVAARPGGGGTTRAAGAPGAARRPTGLVVKR
jgi:hypothetical protein